jgi:hypothetical protein
MGLMALARSRTRKRFTRAGVSRARVILGAASCILLAQWVHTLSAFGGAAASDLFSRWTYVAIGAASGVVLVLKGPQGRKVRGVWLVLGMGQLSKALGDVIYSLAGNLGAVPVASVSDLFWLFFYPCAYVALLLLVRGRVRTVLAATRLDGVICGVTVASALACVTLPLAFSNSAGAPFWETATDLAYPIGDLVPMGAIVSAVALSGWRIDRTLGGMSTRRRRVLRARPVRRARSGPPLLN